MSVSSCLDSSYAMPNPWFDGKLRNVGWLTRSLSLWSAGIAAWGSKADLRANFSIHSASHWNHFYFTQNMKMLEFWPIDIIYRIACLINLTPSCTMLWTIFSTLSLPKSSFAPSLGFKSNEAKMVNLQPPDLTCTGSKSGTLSDSSSVSKLVSIFETFLTYENTLKKSMKFEKKFVEG